MRLYAFERNAPKSSKIAKIENENGKNPEIFMIFWVFLNFLAKCMSTDMLKSFLDCMFHLLLSTHILNTARNLKYTKSWKFDPRVIP